jgi:hypothetical protein
VNLHGRSGSPPGKRSLNRAPRKVNFPESANRSGADVAESGPAGTDERRPGAFTTRESVGTEAESAAFTGRESVGTEAESVGAEGESAAFAERESGGFAGGGSVGRSRCGRAAFAGRRPVRIGRRRSAAFGGRAAFAGLRPVRVGKRRSAAFVRVGQHRRGWRQPWLCLAERVLGGWAPTLRAAVLLLVFAVCLLGLAATALGVIGIAACVVGFTVVWLIPERLLRRFSF